MMKKLYCSYASNEAQGFCTKLAADSAFMWMSLILLLALIALTFMSRPRTGSNNTVGAI